MKYDYIIVGQGIAGTVLSHFLIKNGQNILVIDNGYLTSSSKVAAGIVNPITGRRYVKSWMFDTLLDFAQETYESLGESLNITCFEQRNIVRVLFNNKEENDYYARSGQNGYSQFMLETPDLKEYESVLNPVFSIGEVTKSGKVNLSSIMSAFRQKLETNNQILTEQFDFEQLTLKKDTVYYKNIEAKNIIFCEGIKGTENPFFNYLPFNGAKGQVLIVRIPNFKPQKIFKHRIFFVPLEEDTFWVGATNENDYTDNLPTEKGRINLEKKLQKIIKVPYEIIKHQAAIRPNVKDRRPFIGQHPKFDNLFIFNGLGTKGSSLAPYFANHFVEHLLHQKPLMKEVNIQRYKMEN
ncbi:MAG: NAD(P)/FAD-dependent oxidoreductase [Saprospiraceae bacterium]